MHKECNLRHFVVQKIKIGEQIIDNKEKNDSF